MLKERLMEDLKKSMKEKAILRKNVVQMIRASILQVEKDKQIELDDTQIMDIIVKESKKRKDALLDYEKSGREDLIQDIKEEIAIIAEYLPEQLSEEEIELQIKEIIKQQEATSMKNMGKVMKMAKEKLGATADGQTISKIVKKMLG